MTKRKIVKFTLTEKAWEEISDYAQRHGYEGPAPFARVCVYRIMSMYPVKEYEKGEKVAPGVPHAPYREA